MGGSGSLSFGGRWVAHEKARTVDGSAILRASAIAHVFASGEPTGTLHYRAAPGAPPTGQARWTLQQYAGETALTLTSTASAGGLEHIDLVVEVVPTELPTGGRRFGFVCPGLGYRAPCRRRVDVLYRPGMGASWACRTCHNLTYQSRRRSYRERRLDRLVAARTGVHLRALHALRGRDIARGWGA